MDIHTDIRPVQRSNTNVHDFRPTAATLSIEDVREFTWRDLDQANRIRQQYIDLKVPKLSVDQFLFHLTRDPYSWFIEMGDVGLLFLTGVVPHGNAALFLYFWDSKLPRQRREIMCSVLVAAFEKFDLRKVTASCPGENEIFASFLKKAGFTLEGRIRSAHETETGFDDLLVYGMLRSEAPPTIKADL